jgi:hypothetical protein
MAEHNDHGVLMSRILDNKVKPVFLYDLLFLYRLAMKLILENIQELVGHRWNYGL